MVEKLRRRFITVAMLSILAVMACIVGAIYTVNRLQIISNSDNMLGYISDMAGNIGGPPNFMDPQETEGPAGQMPPRENGTFSEHEEGPDSPVGSGYDPGTQEPGRSGMQGDLGKRGQLQYRSLVINAETPYRTRFFSVTYENGSYLGSDLTHVASVAEEDAMEYGSAALLSGREKGTENIYRYLAVTEENGSVIIYFLDISEELATTRTFLRGSLIVAAVSYILLFVLIYFISKAAVSPIARNIENQKRFITDAEHEIKTPLAIISANTEALEMIQGKSEWTANIKDQVKRSSELVQRLLVLSKMDEENISLSFKDFSISDAVLETVAPFGAVASSSDKQFEMDIEPGITYKGDERAVRELVSILTDNAIKYCTESGSVLVSLYKEGKKIIFRTVNDVDPGSVTDTSLLFNRFYRTDESRSRDTGGYGIGLSIAQAVADAHGGSISAKQEGGKITFRTVL